MWSFVPWLWKTEQIEVIWSGVYEIIPYYFVGKGVNNCSDQWCITTSKFYAEEFWHGKYYMVHI